MNLIIDSLNFQKNQVFANKLLESKNYILCNISDEILNEYKEFPKFSIILSKLMESYELAKNKKKNLLINGFIYSHYNDFTDIEILYLESLLQPFGCIVVDTGLDSLGKEKLSKSGFDYIEYNFDKNFFIDFEKKIKEFKFTTKLLDDALTQEIFGICLYGKIQNGRKNKKIVEIGSFGSTMITFSEYVNEMTKIKNQIGKCDFQKMVNENSYIFVKKRNPIALFLKALIEKQ